MERHFLDKIDWQGIFVPGVPLAETFVRGTLVYLMLFIFLRFLLRRESGAIGIADLLVVVLIADAAQNAMANEYKSFTDGALLVATILFWNYTLNWLDYRFPALRNLISPPPLPLVKNGKMLRRNMRREMITEEELMSQIRQQGVEKIEEVKSACMEGDGSISVISEKSPDANNKSDRTIPK